MIISFVGHSFVADQAKVKEAVKKEYYRDQRFYLSLF